MHRRLPAVLIVLAVLLPTASNAAAHELQVVPPGPVELDLGLLSRELLVHATLRDADDDVRLTLVVPPADEAWLLEVLVPDAEPERSAKPSALPSLEFEAGGVGTTESISANLAVRDEVTGVRYLVAAGEEGGLALQPGRRNVVTIDCAQSGSGCGAAPTRLAIRVFREDGVGFAAQDVDRTRRSVARVTEWAAVGSQQRGEGAGSSADSRRTVAGFGAGIALLGVVLALWWVVRGRRRARVRGAERADQERVGAAPDR